MAVPVSSTDSDATLARLGRAAATAAHAEARRKEYLVTAAAAMKFAETELRADDEAGRLRWPTGEARVKHLLDSARMGVREQVRAGAGAPGMVP